MGKLSLDALKERAEAIASEDLLATISGGTENACHPLAEGPIDESLKDIKNPDINIPAPKQPAPDKVIIKLPW